MSDPIDNLEHIARASGHIGPSDGPVEEPRPRTDREDEVYAAGYKEGFEAAHPATEPDGSGHSGEGVSPEYLRGWKAGREWQRERAEAAHPAPPHGHAVNGDWYPCEAAHPATEGLDGRTRNVLREFLWTAHGHEGLYGDDGERQCGQCGAGFDYRRGPLPDLIEQAYAALSLARLSSPEGQK